MPIDRPQASGESFALTATGQTPAQEVRRAESPTIAPSPDGQSPTIQPPGHGRPLLSRPGALDVVRTALTGAPEAETDPLTDPLTMARLNRLERLGNIDKPALAETNLLAVTPPLHSPAECFSLLAGLEGLSTRDAINDQTYRLYADEIGKLHEKFGPASGEDRINDSLMSRQRWTTQINRETYLAIRPGWLETNTQPAEAGSR
jgi:hypothetical protein